MPDPSELAHVDGASAATDGARGGDDEVARLREETAHLLKAIESRDVIGQAKGILMERQKVTATEAFEELRQASQQANIKLVDIARELAESGEWPVGRMGGA